jgi:hypothetical protein
VRSRLDDLPIERVLTVAVREELPDVVHALAYGAGASLNLPWLAERLGVPCVVTLRTKEAFCHRGTLINESGEDCNAWNQPERCAQCCLTPTPDGLGPVAAACGRLLARLQWISPYPQDLDFLNRLELVVGGLASAQRMLVAEPSDSELLEQAGVKVPTVCLEDPYDAEALVEVYREMMVA